MVLLVLKHRVSPNAWLPAWSNGTWELYVLGEARKQRVKGGVQGGQLYH